MKRFTLFAISLLVIFTACKKDHPVQPEKSITGEWDGSCITNSEASVIALKFQLDENGHLSSLSNNGAITAEGNWSLEGTQFYATYQDVPMKMHVFSVAGYYDATNGKISGTYTSSISPQALQTFAITKQ